MGSTAKELKTTKKQRQEEIDANGGVIPHGGINDDVGNHCPECAVTQKRLLAKFWAIWERENKGKG